MMKRYLAITIFAIAIGLGFSTTLTPQDKPKAAEADMKALVQGNNEFAFDLYRRLSAKDGNIVFSPYSISSALAMTYGGARGETAEEMAKVLHFTLGQERLHPGFGKLIADLQKDEKGRPYHLHVANSLWGQKGYPFLEEFLQLSQKNYRAGLREVDFLRHPEESRQTINRWVEEQTKEKIKELLAKRDIVSETRLILINAIYFKATWKMPFPKDETKKVPFEVTAAEKPSVPMMHSARAFFNYHAGPDFAVVELPYKGDRLSMMLLLPRKRGGLPEVEKKLNPATLRKALSGLCPHLGEVVLPRFTMTRGASLKGPLADLGMVVPFTGRADFSGITRREGLCIRDVIHKAHIDVDELGTEAAGATAVIMVPTLGFPRFSLRADEPFLFFIREGSTGTLLFMGRVSDPRP